MKVVPCWSETLFLEGSGNRSSKSAHESSVGIVIVSGNSSGIGHGGGRDRIATTSCSSTFLAQLAFLRCVHGPSHVMDTPMPFLVPIHLHCCLTILRRYFHPCLICHLFLLVTQILLVLRLRSPSLARFGSSLAIRVLGRITLLLLGKLP